MIRAKKRERLQELVLIRGKKYRERFQELVFSRAEKAVSKAAEKYESY